MNRISAIDRERSQKAAERRAAKEYAAGLEAENARLQAALENALTRIDELNAEVEKRHTRRWRQWKLCHGLPS